MMIATDETYQSSYHRFLSTKERVIKILYRPTVSTLGSEPVHPRGQSFCYIEPYVASRVPAGVL
jgi:hypothetical protein